MQLNFFWILCVLLLKCKAHSGFLIVFNHFHKVSLDIPPKLNKIMGILHSGNYESPYCIATVDRKTLQPILSPLARNISQLDLIRSVGQLIS